MAGAVGPTTQGSTRICRRAAVNFVCSNLSSTIVLGHSGDLVIGSAVFRGSLRGHFAWTDFNSSSARGHGTLWRKSRNGVTERIGDATVMAGRPRNDRFTRLTITMREARGDRAKRWKLASDGSGTWWQPVRG